MANKLRGDENAVGLVLFTHLQDDKLGVRACILKLLEIRKLGKEEKKNTTQV